MFEKVCKTICAIANIGKGRHGYVLVGVSDKFEDTERIKELDSIQPRAVGKKHVVGISREAAFLNESSEAYFTRWRNAIANSPLSDELKNSVLSQMDFNEYYGLGVIVITVPAQTSLSFYDGQVYWRKGDQTVIATEPMAIAEAAGRF
ncbi:Divergent AAA domain protein [compost metagenome]